MKWTGKLVGGVIGAAFGPWGVAIGALLGHQYDAHTDAVKQVRSSRSSRRGGRRSSAELGAVSDRFFATTFQVMGFVAKSDGRVSEAEINAARGVMNDLKLEPMAVRAAIDHFSRGKRPGFDLDASVLELRRACADRPDLLRVFLEIQLDAAIAGTDLQGPARAIVQSIATLLGVSGLELVHMEAVLRIRAGASQRRQDGSTSGGGRRAASQPAGMQLAEAYEVLEVAATAANEDVVKAYRRQISKHHPDKLQANGLPESMLEHAKQRTQQIIEAYDLIRERRGLT
ncbi:MAG: co-chaperone DjlA [Proteobacteria bacterium]|nr:co-chaperone DjlA [Pseudomonadota bacterium]